MSWSELERLVDQAEADPPLRRALAHCRSGAELVLAARRLGFRITRQDLHRAWVMHRRTSPSLEPPQHLTPLAAQGLRTQR